MSGHPDGFRGSASALRQPFALGRGRGQVMRKDKTAQDLMKPADRPRVLDAQRRVNAMKAAAQKKASR